MSRDYAAEMRAVIDAEAQGTYAAPVVAQHIVEKLRATDPDLLIGYLEAQAVQIIRHAINQRDCSVRTHNRITASRSVFRAAADAADAGDDEALRTNFLGEPYQIEDGSKVPFGLTGPDERLFIMADYQARADRNLMRRAFVAAVHKKAGKRITGDVFDEERLAALWNSISGDPT